MPSAWLALYQIDLTFSTNFMNFLNKLTMVESILPRCCTLGLWYGLQSGNNQKLLKILKKETPEIAYQKNIFNRMNLLS